MASQPPHHRTKLKPMSDSPNSPDRPDHSNTVRHPTDAAEMVRYQVSWGAISAGTVVALVVQVLLTTLGAGLGIATLDIGTTETPEASTFSVLAGIWYLVTGIVAAYLGGYIAARLSERPALQRRVARPHHMGAHDAICFVSAHHHDRKSRRRGDFRLNQCSRPSRTDGRSISCSTRRRFQSTGRARSPGSCNRNRS